MSEKRKEYLKKYAAEHPEQYSASRKRYYEKNKERLLKNTKEKIYCPDCDITITKNTMYNHRYTKKHLLNAKFN